MSWPGGPLERCSRSGQNLTPTILVFKKVACHLAWDGIYWYGPKVGSRSVRYGVKRTIEVSPQLTRVLGRENG